MTHSEFMMMVEEMQRVCTDTLKKKAMQYAPGEDRLEQFKVAAGMRRTNPVDALWGIGIKQITAINMASKNPNAYTVEEWEEWCKDTINYCYLCMGLIYDMEEVKGV